MVKSSTTKRHPKLIRIDNLSSWSFLIAGITLVIYSFFSVLEHYSPTTVVEFTLSLSLEPTINHLIRNPWCIVTFPFIHSELVHFLVNFLVLIGLGLLPINRKIHIKSSLQALIKPILIAFFSFVIISLLFPSLIGSLRGASIFVVFAVGVLTTFLEKKWSYFVALLFILIQLLFLTSQNMAGEIIHIILFITGYIAGKRRHLFEMNMLTKKGYNILKKVETSGYSSLTEEEKRDIDK